jgi:hypothetical protein
MEKQTAKRIYAELLRRFHSVSIRCNILEQSLCTGNHDNCRLHFTRGDFDVSAGAHNDAFYHKNMVLTQLDKNRKYYNENYAKTPTAF